jgi:hypothetical protein
VKGAAAEVSGVLERAPIVAVNVAALAGDRPVGLEPLEHAIDVDRDEATR